MQVCPVPSRCLRLVCGNVVLLHLQEDVVAFSKVMSVILFVDPAGTRLIPSQ